jgi:hypothetical protein
MLSQLTSLSAFAVETAEKLPELPDVAFADPPELDDEQQECRR